MNDVVFESVVTAVAAVVVVYLIWGAFRRPCTAS